MANNKETSDIEFLTSRIDALVHSISDREKLATATKQQIAEFQEKAEKQVAAKLTELEEKLGKSISHELASTVAYTKDLYVRFERMVWLGMALLAGSAVYLGYQTFTDIPQRIKSEVGRIATDNKAEIDKTYLQIQENLKAQLRAVSDTNAKLGKELEEASRQIREKAVAHERNVDEIVKGSTASASAKVDKIAVDYESRFRDHQLETFIQRLRRQSADMELVRQLANSFPTVGTSLQGRIVTTLAEQALPRDVVPALRESLEAWSSDDAAAESAKLNLLIRYGSKVAVSHLTKNLSDAIVKNDGAQVVSLVTSVWKAFSGTNSPPPSYSAPSRGRRVLGADARETASYYSEFLRLALESSEGRSALAMVLEIVAYSSLQDNRLNSEIARVLLTQQPELPDADMATLVLSIPRIGEDANLYRAIISAIDRTDVRAIKGISSGALSSLPSDVLAYATKNRSLFKYDPQILTATIRLISRLPLQGAIESQFLEQYLTTDNIFPGGKKILLTSPSDRQEIRRIQGMDRGWTPIKGVERHSIQLRPDIIARVQAIEIDGTDFRDEDLGVRLAMGIEGSELQVFSFTGKQRFFVQSHPNHVIKAKQQEFRIGIEVQDGDIWLMLSP